jgi:hypothetical protein
MPVSWLQGKTTMAIENPPDTPISEWLSGIDNLLAEIEAGDAVPATVPVMLPPIICWGCHGEIINPPAWVVDLMREAEDAGLYESIAEINHRGTRGVNCYGYDEGRGLAVIQVQYVFGRYRHLRKSYFLIGRAEQGRIFVRPVGSPRRLKKIPKRPEAIVQAVLCRIQ